MINELSVKVGDKVVVSGGSPLARVDEIAVVTKVTPTGRVRIDSRSCQYDKFGREMGKEAYYSTDIKKATDEDIKRIEQKNIRIHALNLMHNCKNITIEKAIDIISILEN